MDLYHRLLTRNPTGLTHRDATQLLLWIFCTREVLPPELRHEELGRPELASIFARLGQAEKVSGYGQADTTSPCYWNSCIDEFMSARLLLDESFPARASSFF